MKIALYQGPGLLNDVNGAFALMETQAATAKANGADVLLMPEMYLSGYNIGPEAARRLAVTAAGLVPARDIAKTNGIALVFGYPELVGDAVANSAVLISADGEILLNYRKSHLFGPVDVQMYRRRFCAGGNSGFQDRAADLLRYRISRTGAADRADGRGCFVDPDGPDGTV
jgi:predicted amidohydrolase